MAEGGTVMSVGRQGYFKDYVIAYFIGQLKCLVADSIEPRGSSEFIRRKNEAWFLNKDVHIANARRREKDRRERKHSRMLGEDTQCISNSDRGVTASHCSRKPRLSNVFVERKNESWFSNKEEHIENSRNRLRERIDSSRCHEQQADQATPSFISRVTGLFSFSSWSGEYHVGDHVRVGHYRMTKHGPVWVRPHGVRGHKKKR